MREIGKSIFDDGSEVFANQLFEKLPATVGLKKLFEQNSHLLNEVLSIKIDPTVIPIDPNITPMEGTTLPSGYYNIETEKFKTLFSYPPNHGRDPAFRQYHKESWLEKWYSPYSARWYDFFVQMLLAYYMQQNENNQWKIDFPKGEFRSIDIQEWIDNGYEQDRSVKEKILDVFAFGDVAHFFYGKEKYFKTDNEWFYRIVSSNAKGEERTGFGMKGEETLFKFGGDAKTEWISRVTLENKLLPLYIQVFIDIHNPNYQGRAEIKKLFEITKYLLEKKCFWKSFNSSIARKETPLQKE